MSAKQQQIRVTESAGQRIRALRQGRRRSPERAAARTGVPVEAWMACEAGESVEQEHYKAILALFGLTPQAMAFIERAAERAWR